MRTNVETITTKEFERKQQPINIVWVKIINFSFMPKMILSKSNSRFSNISAKYCPIITHKIKKYILKSILNILHHSLGRLNVISFFQVALKTALFAVILDEVRRT